MWHDERAVQPNVDTVGVKHQHGLASTLMRRHTNLRSSANPNNQICLRVTASSTHLSTTKVHLLNKMVIIEHASKNLLTGDTIVQRVFSPPPQ